MLASRLRILDRRKRIPGMDDGDGEPSQFESVLVVSIDLGRITFSHAMLVTGSKQASFSSISCTFSISIWPCIHEDMAGWLYASGQRLALFHQRRRLGLGFMRYRSTGGTASEGKEGKWEKSEGNWSFPHVIPRFCSDDF